MRTNEQIYMASGLNIVAGVWLILAPYLFGYVNTAAATNDILLGIVIGVLALIRVLSPMKSAWASGVNFVLALWLIVAPFVLGYEMMAARWNDILLGVIVLTMSTWSYNAVMSKGAR